MSAQAIDELFSSSARVAQPTAIREMCRLVAKPEMRSLAGGWPDAAAFPVKNFAEAMSKVLAEKPELALQYCQVDGVPALRDLLAQWSREHYQIDCQAENILILQGSQQGVDLACRVFLDKNDAALVCLPTYMGGFGAMQAYGVDILGVETDENGPVIESIRKTVEKSEQNGVKIKLFYTVPTLSNPSGQDWSRERRAEVVALAKEYNFIILEDDPYGDLRFEGECYPCLKSLDDSGHVIHVRSFTKTVAPGIRMGWAITTPEIHAKLGAAKNFVDTCSNSLMQYALIEYIQAGHLEEGIKANRALYKEKRDTILAAMKEHFPPEVSYVAPKGGFFVWCELPEFMNGNELMKKAAEAMVAFVPGGPFFSDGSGVNTIRLSFSQAPLATIKEAVEVLGGLISQEIAQNA